MSLDKKRKNDECFPPVLIQQINVVGTKSFERFGDLLPDESGVSTHSLGADSELGAQEDVASLPTVLEPLADEFL